MGILTIPFQAEEAEAVFTELPTGIASELRSFFKTGATLPLRFRLQQLRALKSAILAHEAELTGALQADLGKPPSESSLTELFVTLRELDHALRKVRGWMRPHRVRTDVVLAPARSYRLAEPWGVVLIIAPWNYPVQLTLVPLVGAIAAGNCAIVKPSELAPETSTVLKRIIEEAFSPEYVAIVEGGPREAAALLEQQFDYIFFTGSSRLGKIVMRAAADHLTPLTLELGGKNPVLVDQTANIPAAARRIVWAKYLNAGQTCVSPDYLLVHRSAKERLLSEIALTIRRFYGDKPRGGGDLSRIVNRTHYDRLQALLSGAHIVIGGRGDDQRLFLEPTVIDDVGSNSPIMTEEIFGPILPVIAYDDLESAVELICRLATPLAFYVFSADRRVQHRLIRQVPAGGACINDCISQMLTAGLPFGGVGASGMGSYHGYESFRTFSHFKSVMEKPGAFETTFFKYPPYSGHARWIELARRLFT